MGKSMLDLKNSGKQITSLNEGDLFLAMTDPEGAPDNQVVSWQAIKELITLSIYPVGSIYTSVSPTDPGTLFGGTWEAFGKGRVLVGYDASQSEFNAVEKTGGAKTHTLTVNEMPSHTHTQNAHAHSTPPHDHNVWQGDNYITGLSASGGTGSAPSSSGSFSGLKTGTASPATNSTTAVNLPTGGGQAHNNLQPYVVVYMWKRIA